MYKAHFVYSQSIQPVRMGTKSRTNSCNRLFHQNQTHAAMRLCLFCGDAAPPTSHPTIFISTPFHFCNLSISKFQTCSEKQDTRCYERFDRRVSRSSYIVCDGRSDSGECETRLRM